MLGVFSRLRSDLEFVQHSEEEDLHWSPSIFSKVKFKVWYAILDAAQSFFLHEVMQHHIDF